VSLVNNELEQIQRDFVVLFNQFVETVRGDITVQAISLQAAKLGLDSDAF